MLRTSFTSGMYPSTMLQNCNSIIMVCCLPSAQVAPNGTSSSTSQPFALQQLFEFSVAETQKLQLDTDDVLGLPAPHPWYVWKVVNDVAILWLGTDRVATGTCTPPD